MTRKTSDCLTNLKQYLQKMNKIPETRSAGGVIINHNHNVLLVEEFGEFWGLPRGHIEEGEDEIEAAIREIFEETGIKNLTRLLDLGSYTRSTFDSKGIPNYKEIKHITMFAFTTTQLTIKPRDTAITDVRWFDPNDAEIKFINKDDKDFFIQAMKSIRPLLSKPR